MINAARRGCNMHHHPAHKVVLSLAVTFLCTNDLLSMSMSDASIMEKLLVVVVVVLCKKNRNHHQHQVHVRLPLPRHLLHPRCERHPPKCRHDREPLLHQCRLHLHRRRPQPIYWTFSRNQLPLQQLQQQLPHLPLQMTFLETFKRRRRRHLLRIQLPQPPPLLLTLVIFKPRLLLHQQSRRHLLR
jgi:hypothetical protein